MKKVTTSSLPPESLLTQRITANDFVDCYTVKSDMSPRQAANIITSFPGWVRFLLQVRGIVTSPFGLSQDGPDATDKVGIFPVESENQEELIAGFNDKHLDFRVSIISKAGNVFLATWVHPHNIGGRLYLKAIMPFHILISRDALTRVQAHR
ncbi:MAG: DUF2867 domain-containing protein [Granulosicoccus sp.]